MALNEIVYYNNAILAQTIGILALIMILFEVLPPSLSLATLGVVTG